MTALLVREATRADASAIGAICVEAQRAAYAGVMTTTYLTGLSDALEGARWGGILSRDRRVLVAEISDAVVGFARWGAAVDGEAPSDTAELRDLFVDPDFWGRRVGSDLSDTALERMCEDGFRRATLWVVAGNARARVFYAARGWRADGAEEHHDRFESGALVHVVRYARSLSAP